jgi:Translation initiation factor 2, beta subunit (eIF-2beta)/eIF-5 N-terminal domain
MNYDTALDRAMTELPERSTESSRLQIPDPEGESDGAFTRLTNIDDIADALSREPEHVHRSIQREFGTNGQFEDGRARYNGSFSLTDFEAAIDAYVAEFVTCSECGLPDTRLVTEDGIDMLRCEACGAFRPVEKRTAETSQTQEAVLEEGKTYDVHITGTGRKGDGVAERGKYTIFVEGAQEGQDVTIYIKNISGSLAFARLA